MWIRMPFERQWTISPTQSPIYHSMSMVKPDWQCLTKHLLTDTTDWGSDCTVNIHCWHYRLTVIDCTQKIYNTNNWKCIKLHTVTSHHHQLTLTVINCHWQPSTDIDSQQLTLTVINCHWQLVVNCHRQSLTDTAWLQSHILTWSWLYWEVW